MIVDAVFETIRRHGLHILIVVLIFLFLTTTYSRFAELQIKAGVDTPNLDALLWHIQSDREVTA